MGGSQTNEKRNVNRKRFYCETKTPAVFRKHPKRTETRSKRDSGEPESSRSDIRACHDSRERRFGHTRSQASRTSTDYHNPKQCLLRISMVPRETRLGCGQLEGIHDRSKQCKGLRGGASEVLRPRNVREGSARMSDS